MRRPLLLWALLGAVWVWGLPGGAGGCVLCDPAAGAALGQLLGPFLERALPAEPAARGRLGTLVLRGVLGLARLPRDPRSFMGVIDQATLEEASSNFRRTLSRVMAQEPQDQQIYQELLWAMREIKEDFERLMKRFQSQGGTPKRPKNTPKSPLGTPKIPPEIHPWNPPKFPPNSSQKNPQKSPLGTPKIPPKIRP
ncbi:izumo sperm-egg fusion protein 1-like [Agelaius tricolor]|uniref:izumo sperm-egg fusion protein 1-like n=1 Tax=Agelaius tricolor TaxID=9191 RepID=UPI0039F1F610